MGARSNHEMYSQTRYAVDEIATGMRKIAIGYRWK